MIVVDTSALMAIVLDEPDAEGCMAALEFESELLISAGTVAEVLIVAAHRNVGDEIERLIDDLGFEIVDLTAASSRRVSKAYRAWGKAIHPASLNFGDCFAYELAKQQGCRLLFVGNDFSKTDIESVL